MKIVVTQELSTKLRLLLDLQSDEFSRLCSELQRLPTKLFPNEQINDAVQKSGIQSQKPDEVYEAVLDIFYFLFAHGEETARLVEAVAKELTTSGLEEGQRKEIAERLAKLFAIQTLFVSIKATYLFNDSEKVVVGSKILTDVRPIFSNEDNGSLLGYVVVNNLKLVFQDSTGTREFVAAISADELAALDHALSRAKIKREKILSENPQVKNLLVGDK